MIDRIRHTLKWGLKHTRDGVERSLSPSDFQEINDRVYLPPWVDSESPESIYLGFDSRQKDEYFAVRKDFQRPQLYPVLDNSEPRQSVSLSPSGKFTGIDTQVVDIQNASAVELNATFVHPNGKESEKSVQYNLQDSYLHEGSVLPISFTVTKPAKKVTISLNTENESGGLRPSVVLPESIRQYDFKPDQSPRLSVPAPRGKDGNPVFLISVDTLRYDALEMFEPVIEILGDDAVVPEEPRTQGHWTRPAHASMFTGVHPGRHGYVGTGGEDEGQYGIPPDLTTIPELLADNLYKCSGCVTRSKTGIEYGFGRGMHRYSYKPISWMDPDHDGADSIDQIIQWVEDDRREQSDRLFYFLHLFDPHYPYVPTVFSDVSPVDLDLLDNFKSKMAVEDYLETLKNPSTMADDEIKLIKSYYYRSVEYIARHLARLIQHLKRVGLYSNALLIITGDHGEDFFEREFAGHHSVTDANIRPGMIIKPPAESDFEIPDNADIIDFLPTIAELVGDDIPDQCKGVAWHHKTSSSRITERIRPDWYTISVEKESIKGIYTYEENYPSHPTESQVTDGPVDVRFYDTSSRAQGEPLERTEPSNSLRREFEQIIKNHISRSGTRGRPNESVEVSAEVEERLKKLGYK